MCVPPLSIQTPCLENVSLFGKRWQVFYIMNLSQQTNQVANIEQCCTYVGVISPVGKNGIPPTFQGSRQKERKKETKSDRD